MDVTTCLETQPVVGLARPGFRFDGDNAQAGLLKRSVPLLARQKAHPRVCGLDTGKPEDSLHKPGRGESAQKKDQPRAERFAADVFVIDLANANHATWHQPGL